MMYDVSMPTFIQYLRNLRVFLERGEAMARERGYSDSKLLEFRLAPDQFPLDRQVQATCDTSKFAGARLTGTEAPKHDDTEASLEELRARIDATVNFLESLKPEQFAGAEDRDIKPPFAPDQRMRGRNYLLEFALPNFFFHLTHAYAILRAAGVHLGKRDFIGRVTFEPRT